MGTVMMSSKILHERNSTPAIIVSGGRWCMRAGGYPLIPQWWMRGERSG